MSARPFGLHGLCGDAARHSSVLLAVDAAVLTPYSTSTDPGASPHGWIVDSTLRWSASPRSGRSSPRPSRRLARRYTGRSVVWFGHTGGDGGGHLGPCLSSMGVRRSLGVADVALRLICAPILSRISRVRPGGFRRRGG